MTVAPDLYSDFAFAQIAASVSPGDTVITVDDTSAFPSDNTLLGKTNFTLTFEATLLHPNTLETAQLLSVDSSTQITTSGVSNAHPVGGYVKGTLTSTMLQRVRAGYSDSVVPPQDDTIWIVGDRFLLSGSNTSYVYTTTGWQELVPPTVAVVTLSPFLLMGA